MPIETGSFKSLGQDYESGTNAALLAAIAQSAEELTSGAGWPHGVDLLLAALGRVTGVSRVWIFQTIELTETHITQDYAFEWAASGKYKQIGMSMFSMNVNKIAHPQYREMIESRKKGQWQKVLTSKLEPGWLLDSQNVQQIKSMLTIPIMVEGTWWGTLGFDDCERDYDWSDVEIALLRTAGFLISNAVLRDHLSAKRQQFDIFRQLTDSNAWQVNLKSLRVWCTTDILHSVPQPTENLYLSMREAVKLFHPQDRKGLMQAARAYLTEGGDYVFRHDLRVITDCGGLRWVELIGNVQRDSSGKPKAFAGIAVDIRRRKQEEERLRKEAVTDPLTGTLNRRRFELELGQRLEGGNRRDDAFSLLLLDLDNFKRLNDVHGHAFGDEALKHFAKACLAQLRSGDILTRLGGDEFGIILSGATVEVASSIAERLRKSLEGMPVEFDGQQEGLAVSIGCAVHAGGGLVTPAKLMERADIALYAAKRKGRNRLIVENDISCAE